MRGELSQFVSQASGAVEQLRRLVALHPFFEDVHMRRVLVHLTHRHLVRAPVALGAPAVDLFRARPALWRAKNDHWPAGPLRETVQTGVGLDAPNFTEDRVEGGGHQLMHLFRLIALDEI